MSRTVVIVTGALTGIGKATASAFAQRGDIVVVGGRNDDIGEQVARDLKSAGAVDSMFIHTDVRFERDIAHLIDATLICFGPLDVAVNAAGVESSPTPIARLTTTQYADMFGTNVLGTLLSMKHEMRAMRRHGGGAIFNVSSVYSDRTFPQSALSVAAKHAVIGLSRTAALEAAPFGVRVNAVGPRCIDTPAFDIPAAGYASVDASRAPIDL